MAELERADEERARGAEEGRMMIPADRDKACVLFTALAGQAIRVILATLIVVGTLKVLNVIP